MYQLQWYLPRMQWMYRLHGKLQRMSGVQWLQCGMYRRLHGGLQCRL